MANALSLVNPEPNKPSLGRPRRTRLSDEVLVEMGGLLPLTRSVPDSEFSVCARCHHYRAKHDENCDKTFGIYKDGIQLADARCKCWAFVEV